VANARKIPTAVLDSVGQVYRQPIATIRDINLHFKIAQKSKAIGDESSVADIAPFVSCRCFTGLDDLCRLKLMSFKPQCARRHPKNSVSPAMEMIGPSAACRDRAPLTG
jgi:hypothetical protein